MNLDLQVEIRVIFSGIDSFMKNYLDITSITLAISTYNRLFPQPVLQNRQNVCDADMYGMDIT